jgi:hypothetical protein
VIIEPNKAIITTLHGDVGALRFQRLHARHLARAPWEITAPVTDPQAAHRLAVARSAMLYGSIRAMVKPAWDAYAAGETCGPFGRWQGANLLACKAGSLTTITPPNAEFTPLSGPSWSEDTDGQARATWTSPDPPGTATVYCWKRLSTAYAWSLVTAVDAAADLLTVTALPFGVTYELAIAARNPTTGAWSAPLHAWHTRTIPAREDFDTYPELDPDNDVSSADALLTVSTMKANQTTYRYRDFVVPTFAPAFEHRFTLHVSACAIDAVAGCWNVSNVLHNLSYWNTNSSQAVTFAYDRSGSTYRINFKNYENGSAVIYTDYAVSTYYYVTIDRPSETSLRARVYTNAARTTLKHTHTITVASGRRWRYLFPVVSASKGSTAQISCTNRDWQLWPF